MRGRRVTYVAWVARVVRFQRTATSSQSSAAHGLLTRTMMAMRECCEGKEDEEVALGLYPLPIYDVVQRRMQLCLAGESIDRGITMNSEDRASPCPTASAITQYAPVPCPERSETSEKDFLQNYYQLTREQLQKEANLTSSVCITGHTMRSMSPRESLGRTGRFRVCWGLFVASFLRSSLMLPSETWKTADELRDDWRQSHPLWLQMPFDRLETLASSLRSPSVHCRANRQKYSAGIHNIVIGAS